MERYYNELKISNALKTLKNLLNKDYDYTDDEIMALKDSIITLEWLINGKIL